MTPSRGHTPGSRGLAFGPFLFDPVRRLLWHDEALVPLTAKAFEVLATLLEHRDQVLHKDDLLKRVWPGTFVQENNLVRHVSMLRKGLGQRPDQHDYIVTIPGIGYRFVAQVAEVDLPDHLPTSPRIGPDEAPPLAVPTESSPEIHTAELRPPTPNTVESAPTTVLPVVATREVPRERRRLLLAGATLLAAAAVVGFTFFWRADNVSAFRSLRQVTYGPDTQLGPTWSPDGRSFAFASNRSGDFEIWLQRLDDPAATQVTNSAGADWQPSWSPDGSLLAFRSERDGGGIYVASPRGEALRRVSSFGHAPSWSPDGRLLLFYDGRIERIRPQAYVVGLDGAPPRPARADLSANLLQIRVAWHPDGDLTIWGRGPTGWTMIKAPTEGGGQGLSYTLPADMAQSIVRRGLVLSDFAWAPSGRYLYFEGRAEQVNNLWRVSVSPDTMEWLTEPEPLTTGAGSDGSISLSKDGTHLAFGTMAHRTRLWSFPLDPDSGAVNGSGVAVTPGGAGEYDAAVSADGETLIFRTVRSGRQELWEHRISDGRQRVLIAGSNADWSRSSPRVSPDGTRVAYRITRTIAGQRVPAVAILDSTGSERIVTAPGDRSLIPDDWAAGGNSLLGTCTDEEAGRFSICSLSLATDGQTKIFYSSPDRDFFSARYSPNQRWISAVQRSVPRDRNWKSIITVIPASGGNGIAITDGRWNDEKPRWSADGRVIYFVSNRSGLLNVWGRRFDPESGTPVGDVFEVTRFRDPSFVLPTDMAQVEISVTGQHIYLPITEVSGTIWTLAGVDH